MLKDDITSCVTGKKGRKEITLFCFKTSDSVFPSSKTPELITECAEPHFRGTEACKRSLPMNQLKYQLFTVLHGYMPWADRIYLFKTFEAADHFLLPFSPNSPASRMIISCPT